MKSYKKPVLNVERFTANEFVAACGDSGVSSDLGNIVSHSRNGQTQA